MYALFYDIHFLKYRLRCLEVEMPSSFLELFVRYQVIIPSSVVKIECSGVIAGLVSVSPPPPPPVSASLPPPVAGAGCPRYRAKSSPE